jgi:hypothetical protein
MIIELNQYICLKLFSPNSNVQNEIG